MQTISLWLRHQSTGIITLIALVIFVLFMVLVLPVQATKGMSGANGVPAPDLMLYYSSDMLYEMAEAYGAEGRDEFIRARWTFDVIWPLVYTFFLVTSISWLFSKGFSERSPWQLANLFPVFAALLDLLENSANSLVMARYPLQMPVIAALAPMFTLFKWVAVGASFGTLLIGAVVVVWKLSRSKSKR